MSLSQNDVSRVTGGNTALMVCASDGDIENAKLQLANGADINAQNEQGATALLIAILNTKPSMVYLLLENGADASIASKKGLTPKALAYKNGDKGIINMLLDNIPLKKKEAKARIVRAISIISSSVVGWGMYAYFNDLFNPHHSAAFVESIRVAGIGMFVALGYFDWIGKKL